MANDPNRDILPVKEENNGLTGKGVSERFINHQILSRLSRCDLGDKVLNLAQEKAHLKKLVHSHEVTTKRLQTKLQRLTAEKKNKQKTVDYTLENEELNLRIIELEHENYTLKDKNTVLRQQLASHSRLVSVPHSPLKSIYTPALMSVRQSNHPQNEVIYNLPNTNTGTENITNDAESHIKQLNEEIKFLHCKLEYMQQNIEKNSLKSRKNKVTENIELIRLQRSLKQQAIQIGTLQAQVKTSENNQKLLKEELTKAHNENDEAMNVITLKQNEILSLCAQLEKKNLNRFEEEELRERINDLVKERDALKERSDFLLKTVAVKNEKESRRMENLEKSLADEKRKKEELESKLKKTETLLKNLQDLNRFGSEPEKRNCESSSGPTMKSSKLLYSETETDELTGQFLCSQENIPKNSQGPGEERIKSRMTLKSVTPPLETFIGEFSAPATSATCQRDFFSEISSETKVSSERLRMERELQHLREMLRSQTTLCAAQQTEIGRLTHELKLNEDKYNSTLRRLESYLISLEKPEQKEQERNYYSIEDEKRVEKTGSRSKMEPGRSSSSEPEPELEVHQTKTDSKIFIKTNIVKSLNEEKDKNGYRSSSSSVSGLLNTGSYIINSPSRLETGPPKKSKEFHPKKRFIDQVFLESSDEEDVDEEKVEKATLMKKLEILENDTADVGGTKRTSETMADGSQPDFPTKIYGDKSKGIAFRSPSFSSSSSPNFPIENKKSSPIKVEGDKHKKNKYNPGIPVRKEDVIQIGIVWLELEAGSSAWKNEDIDLIFVDFSFLEMKGEETETPDSLRKPKNSNEKCEFNFYKDIPLTENKKKQLDSLLNRPDLDLIVFKVVSEPEKDNDDSECEDIGVAVVTVEQFLYNLNKGLFVIPVHNMNDCKEVIGRLGISVRATPSA